jgi:hypothetical protein
MGERERWRRGGEMRNGADTEDPEAAATQRKNKRKEIGKTKRYKARRKLDGWKTGNIEENNLTNRASKNENKNENKNESKKRVTSERRMERSG